MSCKRRQELERKREKHRLIKEEYYNKGTKELTRLHQSAVVRIRDKNWDTRAVVLEEVAPRSYKVMTQGGAIYRRNRQDLMHVRETFQSEAPEGASANKRVDSKVGDDVREEEVIDNNMEVRGEVIDNGTRAIVEPRVQETQPLRRSSRATKPVDRLDL